MEKLLKVILVYFFLKKRVDSPHSTHRHTKMNNRRSTSARIIICINILECEASEIYSPGVCQEQECVSTSMRGFTERLQPSLAPPLHQDKAQLKEVQWKTTKGCADLWGEFNLWTSSKRRGGGMSHQGIFFHLFIYLQHWNLLWNGHREMQTWLAPQRKVWRHGEHVHPTTTHSVLCVVSGVSLALSKHARQGWRKNWTPLI